MPRKKTYEEYVRQVVEIAPHISVIGQYDGNRTPIEHYCSKHNILWSVSPFNFLQHPNGCKECQNEMLATYHKSITKSNEQFVTEVMALNKDIVPIEEYKGYHKKILFKCKKGHTWSSTPHDILSGYGCPYCSGNKILKGYNDLWTTHPEIAKLLKNPEDGYILGKGSHRNVEWICPSCGKCKITSPKQIITYGFACPICSDGISYPNKFILSLLSQLDVEDVTPEWSPKWVGSLKYDAYFVYNDYPYIIEMDGGIGHGYVDFATGGRDTDGIQRDIIKNNLAQSNNITLIRIDCNYASILNRFQYIKQSILSSQLSDILDLTHVDWNRCNNDALQSLHIKAAKQYDDGCSISQIANNLKVSYSTVYTWLKALGEMGLCSYKPIMGRRKNKII